MALIPALGQFMPSVQARLRLNIDEHTSMWHQVVFTPRNSAKQKSVSRKFKFDVLQNYANSGEQCTLAGSTNKGATLWKTNFFQINRFWE